VDNEPLVASDRPSAGLFDADVVMERDGTSSVTLRVTGELDLLTTPKLEESIALALGDQPAVLIIDLSGVTFLASCAISAVVAAHQTGTGTTMVRVVAAGRETLRPLQLAGLDSSLAIYPTLRHAFEIT
jgi:anti-sigma B factor antagonist